jgi:predicted transcriptional regulator
MSGRTITVTLPDVLYERVKSTAEASARSVEDVCTQSIALSLPELEVDLPSEIRSELAALPLLSDAELATIAHGGLSDEAQDQLEMLAEVQKHRPLSVAEDTTLNQLLAEAQRCMLRKAEAYRLLARRGHAMLTSASRSAA